MISREQFIEALGFEPEQDDLERCNCDKAGQIGHFMCGWDEDRNKPRFIPDPPDDYLNQMVVLISPSAVPNLSTVK